VGPWGFVALAYGIACAIISIYLVALKRRYRRAEAEIDRLRKERK
jgi:heme exporter protein CcmD